MPVNPYGYKRFKSSSHKLYQAVSRPENVYSAEPSELQTLLKEAIVFFGQSLFETPKNRERIGLDMRFGTTPSTIKTLVEEEEEYEFEMSAGNAPLHASMYLSYGSPLNNMAPGKIRSVTSFANKHTCTTGIQGWDVIASIGSCWSTYIPTTTPVTDFRYLWPLNYLEIVPNAKTTASDPSLGTSLAIPSTTSVGVTRVYNEFRFKNMQNIGVFMELMVIGCTQTTAQDPVTDLADAANQYGQGISQFQPPSGGSGTAGRTDGRTTINHLGSRWSDFEDSKRKYKVLRKHTFSLGHGQSCKIDYIVDFNRVYTKMEAAEAQAQGDFAYGNKTVYFVIRYSGEPVVDSTIDAAKRVTTADVSVVSVVTQKKIFQVPIEYAKNRLNYGASSIAWNVTDANQKTINVEDNVDIVQDSTI